MRQNYKQEQPVPPLFLLAVGLIGLVLWAGIIWIAAGLFTDGLIRGSL